MVEFVTNQRKGIKTLSDITEDHWSVFHLCSRKEGDYFWKSDSAVQDLLGAGLITESKKQVLRESKSEDKDKEVGDTRYRTTSLGKAVMKKINDNEIIKDWFSEILPNSDNSERSKASIEMNEALEEFAGLKRDK